MPVFYDAFMPTLLVDQTPGKEQAQEAVLTAVRSLGWQEIQVTDGEVGAVVVRPFKRGGCTLSYCWEWQWLGGSHGYRARLYKQTPIRTPANGQVERINTGYAVRTLPCRPITPSDAPLELAGFEATILEMSWYGDRTVPLQLGEAFHSRRLTIRSSQVGAVATAQRPRWDARRRMALALALLRDPALDLLLTGEDRFENIPEVQARLASAPGDTICHCIRYP